MLGVCHDTVSRRSGHADKETEARADVPLASLLARKAEHALGDGSRNMNKISSSGAVADEIIDIEEFAKAGRAVPRERRYRIRIDRAHYVVDEPCPTGREILKLAGKAPAEFMLSQKFRGGEVKKIEPDERVDLTRPGVERFMTLPLDPTEGSTNAVAVRL